MRLARPDSRGPAWARAPASSVSFGRVKMKRETTSPHLPCPDSCQFLLVSHLKPSSFPDLPRAPATASCVSLPCLHPEICSEVYFALQLLERNRQLSLANRIEDWTSLGATPLFSPACWELGFQAWAQSTCPELPAQKWQPTPVFLPGESQGRGSLVGFCLWGRTESDTTEAT